MRLSSSYEIVSPFPHFLQRETKVETVESWKAF